MYQQLGIVDKKGLNKIKKRCYAKTVFEKYIDKGHDKLITFKRDFVVGVNEEKSNLLLPFE